MGILSSLFNVIKKIIRKVVDLVKKVFKKIWPLLLIVAAIYFAPALAAWFTSAGFTTLGSAFGWVGSTLTPGLTSFLSSAWSGIASIGTEAWAGFKSLELGTQLSIVGGAAALIAPEETGELVGEIGTAVGDTIGAVVGGIASGLPGWIWIAAGGLLIWMLLPSRKDKK